MTSFTLADADAVRQFAESHANEDWDPVEVGNEDQIGNIVMEARTKGIITCPEGAEVDFDYSADGDGGGFQYLVRLTRDVAGKQRTITLASPWSEMRNVVSCCGEVKGAAAVAEILETAVVEANAVVADLAAYHAAEPHALVEPTLAGEVAAVLSQALADADAEIRRIHGGGDYDEGDTEYAVRWRDRVSAVSTAFETAAGRELKIQLLHGRDPDSECDITVYVDGVRFTGPVSVEDSDPGRGYEQEDYEENLESAREAAAKPDATDYDRDILSLLEESEWTYRKFSTGRWEERPEDTDRME